MKKQWHLSVTGEATLANFNASTKAYRELITSNPIFAEAEPNPREILELRNHD